jgi:hypothetical protein
VLLLLEPESPLWQLLTGVRDGRLVLHATGRVTFASEFATWLLGSPGTDLGHASVLVTSRGTSEQLPSGPRRAVRWLESRSEELQGALDSKVEIEQANGLLAGRDGIGTDEAFRRLRKHARDHNLGIARWRPRSLPGGWCSAPMADRCVPGRPNGRHRAFAGPRQPERPTLTAARDRMQV